MIFSMEWTLAIDVLSFVVIVILVVIMHRFHVRVIMGELECLARALVELNVEIRENNAGIHNC